MLLSESWKLRKDTWQNNSPYRVHGKVHVYVDCMCLCLGSRIERSEDMETAAILAQKQPCLEKMAQRMEELEVSLSLSLSLCVFLCLSLLVSVSVSLCLHLSVCLCLSLWLVVQLICTYWFPRPRSYVLGRNGQPWHMMIPSIHDLARLLPGKKWVLRVIAWRPPLLL